MSHAIKSPRKLIEVALPLDVINEESARRKRKSPKGYPTTLHKWFAQRPVAAARAVLFAQLVNDPSWKWELEKPGSIPPSHLKASWANSRKRLFGILGDLLLWENTTNEEVMERARAEIRRSWQEVCEVNSDHPEARILFNRNQPPPLLDPFAGGGTIPLEAQRLGLRALASDLNPVAVLINKALIEIPPRFSSHSPIGPERRTDRQIVTQADWAGPTGLAEEVRRYGQWIADEAKKRIGNFYPPVEITPALAKERPDLKPYVGRQLTVVAWLWARTVKSPNPAFSHVDVPLISNFVLTTKQDKVAYVAPVIDGDKYRFTVKIGEPPANAGKGTKVAVGSFRCLLSDSPIPYTYIDTEATAGRLGSRLMAVVAQGDRGRVYLPPMPGMEELAKKAAPRWKPETPCRGTYGSNAQGRIYGFKTFGDYFSPRQLLALTTLSDLTIEVRQKIRADALAAGMPDDGVRLEDGGAGAHAYADALSLYLAFAVDRLADYGSTLATWRPKDSAMRSTLASQSIQMSWDYAEGSPFADSSSGYIESVDVVACAIEFLSGKSVGRAAQSAAQTHVSTEKCFLSTDPPYYDNIAYADLSDYYYAWLRNTMREVFPSLLATIAVPKAEELVATHYRHGSREKAEAFFLEGMTEAMRRLAAQAHPAAPITIYYAFKQAETEAEGDTASTGWETFLEAVHRAGLAVTGTWPMRTEGDNRQVGIGTNALASSIILVCRPRAADAPTTSRRGFLRELNQVLPEALDEMTRGSGDESSPVAPVDLSQAIIGPGMGIFSKYSAVLESDGKPMSVRTALKLINRFLAEDDFDADTQFCLHWFEQHGWKDGVYGEADVLARAKSTSVKGLVDAGVLHSHAGKITLRKWAEFKDDWDPRADVRIPVWESLHQLIRALKQDGEGSAGRLLAVVKEQGEAARLLAYRLYTMCERQGWSEDARAYNELITSWTGIESAAAATPVSEQPTLFGESQ